MMMTTTTTRSDVQRRQQLLWTIVGAVVVVALLAIAFVYLSSIYSSTKATTSDLTFWTRVVTWVWGYVESTGHLLLEIEPYLMQ